MCDSFGFMDATCPKCNRAFGFFGSLQNMPACANCGHRPSQTELDVVAAKLESEKNREPTEWYQRRCAAGLTLREAAEMIGVHGFYLSSVEWGRVQATEEEYQRMAEIYGE